MSTSPEPTADALFDYSGDEAWRAPITEALRRVVDPEVALLVPAEEFCAFDADESVACSLPEAVVVCCSVDDWFESAVFRSLLVSFELSDPEVVPVLSPEVLFSEVPVEELFDAT